MGNSMSLSTAKVVVPATWAYDFACQQWAILISDPNMKVVNDRNPAAFSPTPFAIGAWFGPQQILELIYIKELFYPTGGKVEPIMLSLAPFFSLGNIMIGTWPFLWNSERLQFADLFVIVNTLQSLYWVYTKRAANPNTWQEKIANAVGYSFAGIGVLDFLHNTSIGFFPRQAPSTLVKALALVGFPLASILSPVAMGLSFLYVQLAITIGQYQLANKAFDNMGGGGGFGWAQMMGLGAVVTATAVGLRYSQTKRVL